MKKFDPVEMPDGLDLLNWRRRAATLRLMESAPPSPRCVVAGGKSMLERQIEEKFGVEVSDAPGDLDRVWPFKPDDGKDVLAFEVLEHLANPLLFLDNVREHLKKTGGFLYLSTPLVSGWLRPRGFINVFHFNEFDDSRLKWLLDKAGLSVEAWETFRPRPWWKHLNPRGAIRWLTDRTVFVVVKPRAR